MKTCFENEIKFELGLLSICLREGIVAVRLIIPFNGEAYELNTKEA